MEVIAIQARSECGKTPTLQIVRKLLKDFGFGEIHFEDISNGDFTAIYEKSEVKVGIASQGDYPDKLEEYLRYLANQGCIRAAAASRTKGQTVLNIQDYPSRFIKKTIISSKVAEDEYAANLADAEKIFAFLTQS